jgi:uroporphyrinogen decarboxylase
MEEALMRTMTSRERVIATLNHQQPDMLPLSIGSSSNDQFTRIALQKFAKAYNIGPYEEKVTWKTVQTVVTPPQVQEMYNADLRMLLPGERDNPFPDHFNPEDGTVIDALGVKLAPVLYYYDVVARPLEGPITMDDVKKHPWPDPYDKGITRGLREKALDLITNTNYALVTDYLALGPFEGALWVRGWEDFMCDLYLDPKLAEAIMDKIVEYWIGMLDQVLSEVGDLIHIVCCNDDLGMQDRSLIPREMYSKYVKKYAKRVYDFVKTKTNAKLSHHSCGSVYEIIPELIDIGVQVLNPLQVSAKNMEPDRLKKRVRQRVKLLGRT